MRHICKDCGSENIHSVSDGIVAIHHEIDLRHFPAEMSDKELSAIKEEALQSVTTLLDEHIKHHKKGRK